MTHGVVPENSHCYSVNGSLLGHVYTERHLKNGPLKLSIVPMNNGQNGHHQFSSIVQQIIIDAMLNNNGQFFKEKLLRCHIFSPGMIFYIHSILIDP